MQFKGMALFRFRLLKTVPIVPVSAPGRTVPTVAVSSSCSVLVPSCFLSFRGYFVEFFEVLLLIARLFSKIASKDAWDSN